MRPHDSHIASDAWERRPYQMASGSVIGGAQGQRDESIWREMGIPRKQNLQQMVENRHAVFMSCCLPGSVRVTMDHSRGNHQYNMGPWHQIMHIPTTAPLSLNHPTIPCQCVPVISFPRNQFLRRKHEITSTRLWGSQKHEQAVPPPGSSTIATDPLPLNAQGSWYRKVRRMGSRYAGHRWCSQCTLPGPARRP